MNEQEYYQEHYANVLGSWYEILHDQPPKNAIDWQPLPPKVKRKRLELIEATLTRLNALPKFRQGQVLEDGREIMLTRPVFTDGESHEYLICNNLRSFWATEKEIAG